MKYQTPNLVFFLSALVLSLVIVSPLAVPIAAGCVIGYVCEPCLEFLQKKTSLYSSFWRWFLSLMLVILILLAFVIPLAFFVVNLFQQGNEILAAENLTLENGRTEQAAKWLSEHAANFGISVSIPQIIEQAKVALLRLFGVGATGLTNVLSATPSSMIDLLVFLMAWCLFLATGKSMRTEFLPQLLPWPRQLQIICTTTGDVLRAVVVSNILVSAVQALIVFLFLWLAQIPQPMFWSGMAFFFSFIPIVGTAPIMIGSAIYAFTHHMPVAAVVLTIGALVVGGVDNVLRPYFAKGGSALSFFWIFVAFVGGITQFGIAGTILGPLAFSLLSAAFKSLNDEDWSL